MSKEYFFDTKKLDQLDKSKLIFIVYSKWNAVLVNEMVEESKNTLNHYGFSNINLLEVPGAWEIPFGCLKAIEQGAKGIITFGVIIKGETPHFEIISNTSSQAIMDLSLKKNIPLVNGIIVANTYDQAQTRASTNGLNKGKEITQSLIEILDL